MMIGTFVALTLKTVAGITYSRPVRRIPDGYFWVFADRAIIRKSLVSRSFQL